MASPEWYMDQLFQNERDGRSVDPDDIIADYCDRMADEAGAARQRRKDDSTNNS